MRRAIAVLALVPFLAAGCGKTLIATGGVITTFGLIAVGIQDVEGQESSGCNDGPGCVDYNIDTNVDESKILITGLVLMGIGAVMHALERGHERDRAEERARAPQPIVVFAEPEPEPEPGSTTGRWREVPPGPEE